jgi:hypothetical protein
MKKWPEKVAEWMTLAEAIWAGSILLLAVLILIGRAVYLALK